MFQGDNLTDDLKSVGVTGVDRISNSWEWNVEEGGPIANTFESKLLVEAGIAFNRDPRPSSPPSTPALQPPGL